MVRQYKIHTNLDGNDNQVIDLTSGKIRLYQPSDLGIVTNTNIWSTQGLGVFGDTAISHPSMDFRLETFGDDLQENYQLMNEFLSKILAQKYVTLEYTSEQGTYYADVKLAKVSKTEGYGQSGTFSETISFDVINKWYTYEQLTFSKFKNADFSNKTKIYTNSRYTYTDNTYLYTTEDNIDRFSKWKIEERAVIDMTTIAIFWIVYEFYNFSKDKAFENEVAMIINLALLFFLMRMIQLIAQLNPMFQEFVSFLKKKGVNVDELDQK